jgi:hypothetical protein
MNLRSSAIHRTLIAALVAFGSFASASASHPKGVAEPGTDWNETVVLVRHGEKPLLHPVGQLNCQGLERALALPAVLARYGHPAAIYAPNPATLTTEGDPLPDAPKWAYIRPLMTIEPYAVALGMPVNTAIATNDLGSLQNAIFQPAYSHALIVVAWEHIQAWKFAEQLLAQYQLNPELAPHWHNDQYDTIYVFHFFTGPDGKRKLDFKVDAEQLDGKLPSTCPVVALGKVAAK